MINAVPEIIDPISFDVIAPKFLRGPKDLIEVASNKPRLVRASTDKVGPKGMPSIKVGASINSTEKNN